MRPTIITVGPGWDASRGGPSTFNRYLSQALARCGCEVWCVVEEAVPAQVAAAAALGVTLLGAADVPARRAAEGVRPLAVIGHARSTGADARALAGALGAPRVHVLHTGAGAEAADPAAHAAAAAELALARGAELTLAVGRRLAVSAQAALPDARVEAFLPGLPAELTGWEPAADAPAASVCLCRGGADEHVLRGLEVAAAAMARVDRRKLPDEDPRLVLGGLPPARVPEVRRRLERLAPPAAPRTVFRAASLSDEVELARELREASVVLVPSREEGFGMSGLEAISVGVPALIGARSGLADFLWDEQLHKNVVVTTTGELATDAAVWAGELEFVLRDRGAAFRRAAVLREALAARLSWERSARELIDQLRQLAGVRGAVAVPRGAGAEAAAEVSAAEDPAQLAARTRTRTRTPSVEDALAAALHLGRGMDRQTAERTRAMVHALAEAGRRTRTFDVAAVRAAVLAAVIEQLAQPRRADLDAWNQLEVAVVALRAKHELLGVAATATAAWLHRFHFPRPEKLRSEDTPRLAAAFAQAEVLAAELAALPRPVVSFAREHGWRVHQAVVSGHAMTNAEVGRAMLEAGEPPHEYAIENLARVFEAAANLVALDPGRIGRGYAEGGELDVLRVAGGDVVVAVGLVPAQDEPQIALYAGPPAALAPAGTLRARRHALDQLRLSADADLSLMACSSRYLYRWSAASPTPEREWRLPNDSDIQRWASLHGRGEDVVYIEAKDATGVAFRGDRVLGSWRSPRGGAAALWRALDGSFFRAYLGAGLTVVRDLDDAPCAGPLDVIGSLLPRYKHLVRPEEYLFGIRPPSRLTPGVLQEQDCLLVGCPLDPGALAIFFLAPSTLAPLRAPLIARLFLEELAVLDAGGRSLLVGTVVQRRGAALAVWDVTPGGEGDDEAAAPPLPAICEVPGAAGRALACVPSADGVDIYFTSRPLTYDPGPASLWHYRWPAGELTRICHLPSTAVSSLAARRRR